MWTFMIVSYTVRIKIKVIHIQRPIVLKSIDLTHPLSIGTFLASGMSRMTEYIAIEDDNVMTPFLQVFVIGMEDCSECWYWQFRWMSALLFT